MLSQIVEFFQYCKPVKLNTSLFFKLKPNTFVTNQTVSLHGLYNTPGFGVFFSVL